MKTVRLTAKGQLSLPVEVVRALDLRKGSELLLVQEGDRVVLTKASTIGKRVVDDLKDFHLLGLSSSEQLWDNPHDEVWNDV